MPDGAGWYRSTAEVELVHLPTGYPSVRFAPGGVEWLPADPQNPNLVPCDAPDVAAADTTRSEQ